MGVADREDRDSSGNQRARGKSLAELRRKTCEAGDQPD